MSCYHKKGRHVIFLTQMLLCYFSHLDQQSSNFACISILWRSVFDSGSGVEPQNVPFQQIPGVGVGVSHFEKHCSKFILSWKHFFLCDKLMPSFVLFYFCLHSAI